MDFVTVILCLLLLRPGLGELPMECPVESSNDRELEGDGVILQNITCNTSHIEVQYRRLAERVFGNTLSVLYTCQDPNGTEILNQVLVESTNSLSDTLVKDLELEHGTVCDIYSCYTSHEYPDETFTRTTPVTCTVVDRNICTNDCIARGAVACQTDTSGSSALGYGCVCTEGYVWNATHCENVNECNTTDPIHQHNCSTGEGYQCFDLEGSFLCVNCTEREEWNGTSCVPLTTVAEDDNFHTTAMTSTDADNFHTTAMTSTDADSFPTTYSTEPDVTTTITTISTLTDYSFVSDGVSSASSVVPTVVGVLTFLVAFIGLLVAATIAVLYLYRKRKSKKRSIYSEINNYYSGYPCYPGYNVDKIDENFNPIDSIDPVRVDHLSTILVSSIASRLNRLWELEEPDTHTTQCTTGTITTAALQHHALTSQPCHLHLSSERLSTAGLSSNNHRHAHSIDSCIEQSTVDEERSIHSADCSASLAHEEITRDDRPQVRDLDDLDDTLPADLTVQSHRCSCVTTESVAGSMAPCTRRIHVGCHFRQSSISTLESEWMHFDLTGSGLTDTSGYITCMSTHDHLEDLEQTQCT